MAGSFGEAARAQREASESLNEVRADKSRAEKTDAQADQSAINARKAKAEGWSKTGWMGWSIRGAREE